MRSIAFLGALFLALGAPAATFLEVDPSVVELFVAPGQETKGQFNVRNPGDTEVLIEVDYRDSWAERTGLPALDPALWLRLAVPKPFVLKPGKSGTVPYSVKPPADFTGEAMAMVFFTGPTKSLGEGPAQVQFRHGIPIYMIAQGTEQGACALKVLDAAGKPEAPVEFFADLKNEGNVHIRPHGSVQVTDKAGKVVLEAPFGYGTPVFPGQTQRYFAKAAALPRGNYVARAYFLRKAGGELLAEGRLGFSVKKTGVAVILPYSEPAPAP